MKAKKFIWVVLAVAGLGSSAAQASVRDLYPNVPVAPGHVDDEYNLAKTVFEAGAEAPADVDAAVTAKTYTCTYYREDNEKKNNVPLVVVNGAFGKNSRALAFFGTDIMLQNPTPQTDDHGAVHYDNGPSAEFSIAQNGDDVSYNFEVRLGKGDYAGTFVVQVTSSDSLFDHEGPQFIVCNY